jgi:cell fate regulator YaaT (PSP1 superfamily)
MKKVLRRATNRDIEQWKQNKSREPEAVIRSRAIAKQFRLDMKISQVEMQADGRKATFFYIADGRVDFRELIKIYATEFKVKVEMRQIGARQEAGKVGGIGSPDENSVAAPGSPISNRLIPQRPVIRIYRLTRPN